MASKKYSFDFDKVANEIKKEKEKKGKGRDKDERFWAPTKDKKGTALAIIRFLPTPKSDMPFVKVHTHFFDYMDDGQKKWWVKNCPSTLQKTCLVCKKNFEYWESPFDSDKDLARKRKRGTQYIANIYVIKDPNNPDSEGKVFLYKFGVKIYDKIMMHWMPGETELQDPDFQEFVAFDPEGGANFKLKVKPVADKPGKKAFPNYDESAFSPVAPFLKGTTKKVEAALDATFDLNEFLDPAQYPSEDEQRAALGVILGETRAASKEAPKEQKAPEAAGDPEDNVFMGAAESGNEEPNEKTEEGSKDGSYDDDENFFNSLGK